MTDRIAFSTPPAKPAPSSFGGRPTTGRPRRTVLAAISAMSVAAVVLAGCDLGDGSGGSDRDEGCFSGVLCVGDPDCPSGQHCNTAVSPPACMTLYCGPFGTPCDEDALCIPGFVCTDSLMCGPGVFDSDAGDTATTDAVTDSGDDADAATDTGGDDADTPPEVGPLMYVLIEDLETDPTTEDGRAGVDIYGAELVTDTGSHAATEVASCQFGAQSNASATNCNTALGGLGATCNPDRPDFVSLGGAGGNIVLSFGRAFETGDRIRVYECGATASPTSDPEYFRISVGPSSDVGSTDWIECAARVTDLASCIVPVVPGG